MTPPGRVRRRVLHGFYTNFRPHNARLGSNKCTVCGRKMAAQYMGMEEWSEPGPMCGACYSAKIHDHYPGKHERMS